MIPDEIIIRQREDGTWEEHKPYMTVEFETEEDFKYFEKVLEDHKRMQWIPCSERLPEEEGSYLLTLTTASGIRYVGMGLLFSDGKFAKHDSVIAWMPLPEAYKGETE